MGGISTGRALLSSVLVLASIGCQPGDTAPGEDERAIREADESFQQAIEAKNLDRLLAHYAENASLLPTASPIAEGHAAIREEWSLILAIPGFGNESELKKLVVSGDLAYTQGTYVATMNSPDGSPVIERGKWVTVWERQSEGSWKIIADIYNTDEMPPDHL